MKPQFQWKETRHNVRAYQTRRGDLERWTSLVWIVHGAVDGRPHIFFADMFSTLIPTTAYIRRKQYATHVDAQKAVERKVAQLMGVMQITGVWP